MKKDKEKNKSNKVTKTVTKTLRGPLGGDLDRRAMRRAHMGAIYQGDDSIGDKQSKARKAEYKKNR